jgi:hypothetical protein
MASLEAGRPRTVSEHWAHQWCKTEETDMIRNAASRLRPLLAQGLRAGATAAEGASGPTKALAGPPGLHARQGRPISTVIQATHYYTVEQGRIQVNSPGHVQFQPSANDLKNNPNLASALGHCPVKGWTQREEFPVQGQLPDGRPFSVTGVRNRARAAGADKRIDPKTASHVIDHGDMTPGQSRRFEAAQGQPVFPHYETSGLDRANCVAGHVELTSRIFGQDAGRKAGEGLHVHAMPQDLAQRMEGVRTEPGAPGKTPRFWGSLRAEGFAGASPLGTIGGAPP